MTDHEPPAEDLTLAERRLREHLKVFTAERPEPAPSLAVAVVRTARWQRSVRAPLQAVGRFAAAIGDGLRLLIGGRRQP
ncbi:MAG: hypothetical protein JO168_23375 [Solirubrobacterales bacterium]|nr:hypothetical protein [Solirubrobacterales bacterium]MBV9716442.1 hypothetical protein [Solirubrobacterales bacterium]